MPGVRGARPQQMVFDEAAQMLVSDPEAPPAATPVQRHRVGTQEVEVASSTPKADGTRDVWYRWTGSTTFTYTPTTATTWQRWVTAPNTSTITIAAPMRDAVWASWNEVGTATATAALAIDRVTVGLNDVARAAAPVTEAMRAELQRQRDALQARREEESRLRLAAQRRLEHAQDRAMDLLLALLTPEESAYHDTHDRILVVAQSGTRYVLGKNSVHGNIAEVDEHGCILGRVCVAPGMYDAQADAYLPLADGWVGQYLALKYDEQRLRTIGNWSHRRPCSAAPQLAHLAA